MDTDFTQDSVLHFLQSRGGSVKNSDLLLHFKGFLRDHADQVRNRELFKKFVNSVATVKQEHGVAHIVLKKKFRGSGPSGVGTAASGTPARRAAEPPPSNPAWMKEKVRQRPLPREHTAPALAREPDMNKVLPAAGILNNNNNNVETNFNLSPEPRVARADAAPAVSHPEISAKTHPRAQGTPEYPAMRLSQPQASVQHGLIDQQVSPPQIQKSKEGSLPHDSLHVQPRRTRHRQSYKTAISYEDDGEEEEEEGLKMKLSTPRDVGPLGVPPLPIASSSTERMLPKISIQNVAEGQVPHLESELQLTMSPNVAPVPTPTRLSLPAEHTVPSPVGAEEQERCYSHPAGVALERGCDWSPNKRTWLSSSHNSIFLYPSDAGFSSNDTLHLLTAGHACTQEVLQRPAETKLGSTMGHTDLKVTAPWHHSTGNLLDKSLFAAPLHRSSDHLDQHSAARGVPWHHSAGDLYDEHELSDCSASSPAPRLRPTLARRISSRLRGRMCRSMGADLNQLLQEEEAAAAEGRAGDHEAQRRKRLHRISSSLSPRYNLSSSSLSSCSTPSRCNSLADLAEVKGKAGAHQESSSRQSSVPLEPREHAWLVKGASGAWPDIYSLFREDCTLLNRQDFISGFTVLHWIAKHGDHRVLNTLWYGVQKAGLSFDINARSSCGQTPLHIAAIHSNKNIIRLLVNKFGADVKLRDTAGKKPWQYLNPSVAQDVFLLLGAPAYYAGGGQVGSPAGERHGERKAQQRRRHRQHHPSFSSQGQRPRSISGTKVKRSSSIAAFLKNKSLARFHGYKSDG